MRKSGLFGKGGLVTYSDTFPQIDPLSKEDIALTSYIPTHYKAKDWAYEQEYRLTKLFFPNSPTNGDRIKIIPEGFIEEVNLGMNISDKNKKEIIDECRNREIPIYQIFKTPFKFEINRIKL